MPQPRSQLVTVRRPRAKSSPVQSCTNRACWRASSVPAKAVIQTTSDTGSHCDSIHGSPSHDSVAISNHSMRGEPPHLKSPPASGTPNEVPDFWESADGCMRRKNEGSTCCGLEAGAVDDLVAQQVLRALEPATLELSLKAIQDVHKERDRLHRHWKHRLERATYEAERAERQYRAVEPENRLVARSLERHWEEALRNQRDLAEEYDRFLKEQPPHLSEDQRARILALSSDLPTLWNAPETTAADRKEIIRLVVQHVEVHVRAETEWGARQLLPAPASPEKGQWENSRFFDNVSPPWGFR